MHYTVLYFVFYAITCMRVSNTREWDFNKYAKVDLIGFIDLQCSDLFAITFYCVVKANL